MIEQIDGVSILEEEFDVNEYYIELEDCEPSEKKIAKEIHQVKIELTKEQIDNACNPNLDNY